jgi:hypothetical protein
MLKTKLVLKMRVFETHFLTTKWPKKNFLLGIVFFGGDYPPIANKCLSTVLVQSVGFPLRTLHIVQGSPISPNFWKFPKKTYAISGFLAEILPVPISPNVPISPKMHNIF